MKYSKGVSWVDDTRIPYIDEGDKTKPDYVNKIQNTEKHTSGAMTGGINKIQVCNDKGRFTPNLLVCDDMLNDGIIYKSGDGSGNMELININDAHHFSYENPNRKITKMKGVQYNDKGTNSRYYDLDKWFDKIIDEIQ